MRKGSRIKDRDFHVSLGRAIIGIYPELLKQRKIWDDYYMPLSAAAIGSEEKVQGGGGLALQEVVLEAKARNKEYQKLCHRITAIEIILGAVPECRENREEEVGALWLVELYGVSML